MLNKVLVKAIELYEPQNHEAPIGFIQEQVGTKMNIECI